jgi:hypothetical protein
MSPGKKIKLILEMVDIDPDIPLNASNWGHITPDPDRYQVWNSRIPSVEDGVQADETLPLYNDNSHYDLENRQSKVFIPPLSGKNVHEDAPKMVIDNLNKNSIEEFKNAEGQAAEWNKFTDLLNKIPTTGTALDRYLNGPTLAAGLLATLGAREIHKQNQIRG